MVVSERASEQAKMDQNSPNYTPIDGLVAVKADRGGERERRALFFVRVVLTSQPPSLSTLAVYVSAVALPPPVTTTVTMVAGLCVLSAVPHTRAGTFRCSTMELPRAAEKRNAGGGGGGVGGCTGGLQLKAEVPGHVYISQFPQAPAVHGAGAGRAS